MSPDQISILQARLTRTEGRRYRPYVDTVGKVTIGIGHNLTDDGIDDEVVNLIFAKDIAVAEAGAKTLPVYSKLDSIRQTVIIDLVFNMGLDRLKEFVNTLSFLNQGRYEDASLQLLDSAWAKEVGTRADELARIMRDGHI